MTVVRWLAATAGLVFAAAALVPESGLRRGGDALRHAADVTPERVDRYRLWCGSMAAAFGVAALLLHRNRAAATAFFANARSDLKFLPEVCSAGWTEWAWQWKVGWLAVIGVGLGLRLWHLNAPMAYDEAYSFTNFARRPLVEALSDYNNTNNHLLNTLGMHVCWRLFGNHEWALRLPALAGGIACLLLAVPWAFFRLGIQGGIVLTALLASSPMLVDYSTNARGYTPMLAAAMYVDLCFQPLARGWGQSQTVSWLGAWVGIVVGMFAVPVMLHPLAGLCLGFALAPLAIGQAPWRRWRNLAILLAAAALATALLYGPGYVFRGAAAARHDFVQPLPLAQWAAEFPRALAAGAERWCAGPVPVWAWFALVACGLAWMRTDRREALAAVSMAVGGLGALALQRVAPPPRMFLFLAPWFYWLVARGIGVLAQSWSNPRWRRRCFAPSVAIALLPGAWHCLREPILREPQQRDFGIGSVRDAIAWIAEHPAADPRQRVLAALPLDHPAIYYADRNGLAWPINGEPQPGERLWRLVLPAAPADPAWMPAAEFPELTLETRIAP